MENRVSEGRFGPWPLALGNLIVFHSLCSLGLCFLQHHGSSFLLLHLLRTFVFAVSDDSSPLQGIGQSTHQQPHQVDEPWRGSGSRSRDSGRNSQYVCPCDVDAAVADDDEVDMEEHSVAAAAAAAAAGDVILDISTHPKGYHYGHCHGYCHYACYSDYHQSFR